MSSLGPLRELASVRNPICAKACAPARLRAGQRRGSDSTPRCAGSAVVRALGSRRITPSACCARCGRTDAASQSTKRAGTRADPRAALLAVSYSPRRLSRPGLACTNRRRADGGHRTHTTGRKPRFVPMRLNAIRHQTPLGPRLRRHGCDSGQGARAALARCQAAAWAAGLACFPRNPQCGDERVEIDPVAPGRRAQQR